MKPHCPKAFGVPNHNETVTGPPDSFSILTWDLGPASAIFIMLSHVPDPSRSDVAVAAGGITSVGKGSGVKVGGGVGLAVSVGGSGVAVGIACCVAATIVHAAATAVPSTSTGDIVGVPCGPHAVSSTAVANIIGMIFLYIRISNFMVEFLVDYLLLMVTLSL